MVSPHEKADPRTFYFETLGHSWKVVDVPKIDGVQKGSPRLPLYHYHKVCIGGGEMSLIDFHLSYSKISVREFESCLLKSDLFKR